MKLGCNLSSVPVWPQDLIDITGNVLSGQAAGEVSPSMTNPALKCLRSYIVIAHTHSVIVIVSFCQKAPCTPVSFSRCSALEHGPLWLGALY